MLNQAIGSVKDPINIKWALKHPFKDAEKEHHEALKRIIDAKAESERKV